MRKLLLSCFILFTCLGTAALAADGVISMQSESDVKITVDRLVKILKAKGMTVFTRIDHAAGASKVGVVMRPTVLVLFGNPKAGTPLMMCQRSVAIDLPQKALIWEDANGKTWLSYNDPHFLVKRHDIKGCDEAINRVAKALNNFASNATTAE